MFKELEVPFLTSLDEPSITLVRPGYREKYASTKIGSEIYHDLENFEGKPGKSYILVVAVSPHEYWGPNKNHDSFTEEWLKKKHGTFVENGTFYKNHVNKDPLKNYGDNAKSWYDDEMKRVLVLVGVDHKKAPDIVNDIEMGKRISVSMGCKIPYDVCSICGNKAPTRAEYCQHMKREAGKIYPDGRRVFVYNPDPTFFDLSKVVRPAGHIEYMIKHVVPKNFPKEAHELWTPKGAVNLSGEELFEKAASLDEKYARLAKLCTMTKVIQGEAVGPEDISPRMKEILEKSKNIVNLKKVEDIDDDTLGKVAEFPLKSILSTLNLLGIQPSESEMTKIIIIRSGKPEVEELQHNLDREGLDHDRILRSSSPLHVLQDHPRVLRILEESGLFDASPDHVEEKVAELLMPYMEKRSNYPVFLEKRAFTTGGSLDVVPAYDAKGNKYLTTAEAISSAAENGLLNTGAKALTTGALATGATLLAPKLLPFLGGKSMLPARIFGGLAGGSAVSGALWDHPAMSPVPAHTIMQKAGSLLDRHDRDRFMKTAFNEDMMNANALYPMSQGPTIMDRMQPVFNWAQSHPTLATLAGLTVGGLGAKGISRLGGKIKEMGLSGNLSGLLSTRPVPKV